MSTSSLTPPSAFSLRLRHENQKPRLFLDLDIAFTHPLYAPTNAILGLPANPSRISPPQRSKQRNPRLDNRACSGIWCRNPMPNPTCPFGIKLGLCRPLLLLGRSPHNSAHSSQWPILSHQAKLGWCPDGDPTARHLQSVGRCSLHQRSRSRGTQPAGPSYGCDLPLSQFRDYLAR